MIKGIKAVDVVSRTEGTPKNIHRRSGTEGFKLENTFGRNCNSGG